jgi:hypothetical protein
MAKDRPAKMPAPSTVLKPCAYGAIALFVIPAVLKMALGGG